ncbi:MAG: hypothetical protein H0V81_06535 [Solirubrobacterales bacterium]|nr:hypothetical protein [Solirubrobacterales bacterium]
MDDDDRENHFFSVLGGAVEAARIGGLCVRVELEDGTTVEGVPEDSPLAEGKNVTEIDHSGVRADLVLGDTLVMVSRIRRFAVDRPQS